MGVDNASGGLNPTPLRSTGPARTRRLMHLPRLRPSAAPAELAMVDDRPEPAPAEPFTALTRPVLGLPEGRRVGSDVLVQAPPIRLGPGADHDVVVTARFALSEARARQGLPAFNASLLRAALAAGAGADDSGSGPTEPFVAVAVEVAFVADDDFLDTVKAAVRAVDAAPQSLLLSVVPDPELTAVWPSLQRLRSHGVRIALEHEGPTADCVDWLHRLPFDVVRLPAASVLRLADGPSTTGWRPDPAPNTPEGWSAGPALQRLVALDRAQVWLEDVRTRAEVEALGQGGAHLISGPAAA